MILRLPARLVSPYSHCPVGPFRHANGSALPINVLPFQPNVLAGAHPGSESKGEKCSVHRWQCKIQENLCLLE
jgi:hypothetical protein